MKKATWRSRVLYDSGTSITQFIHSKDIVEYMKKNKLHIGTGCNKIHSFVFPYMVSISNNQSSHIKNIVINELKNND